MLLPVGEVSALSTDSDGTATGHVYVQSRFTIIESRIAVAA
jgi:hypothetical protein